MKQPLEVFQHFKTLENVPTKLVETCKQMIIFLPEVSFSREESLEIPRLVNRSHGSLVQFGLSFGTFLCKN